MITHKPKIAVIIQRYGRSVLGGETLCRMVMEHLRRVMDITVLTTAASDYRTWHNDLPSGWQEESGVTILRFPVRRYRSLFLFKWFTRFVYVCQWLNNKKLLFNGILKCLQRRWLKLQGPYCPDLILYLQENQHRYDAFIFFTYLYYPTACGIEHVANKAILFPSAHDERPIYLNWYRRVFAAPAALIMQTPEERDFVNKVFDVNNKPQRMAAMHIPTLADLSAEQINIAQSRVTDFIHRYQLNSPYILYTGRIELSKGGKWMLQHFLNFIKDTKSPVELVLLGRAYIKIPKHPQIRYLGFLTEAEKRSAILGCQFFLMPSFYESFSVSLLEALGMGKPAIVNAYCPVLQGHMERSQAGFAVNDYAEFKSACLTLLSAENIHYGKNGMEYVRQNYTWEKVIETYLELVEMIKNKSKQDIANSNQNSLSLSQLTMTSMQHKFTARQRNLT